MFHKAVGCPCAFSMWTIIATMGLVVIVKHCFSCAFIASFGLTCELFPVDGWLSSHFIC